MANPPRLFTIPASTPFLETLIEALRAGRLVPGFPASGDDDPLAFARATLYLPTRRACRLARDLFADAFAGRATILPRIIPIGDIDEDEIAFAEAATGELAGDALDIPPALSGLERRLLLTQLVQAWSALPEMRSDAGVPLVATTPASALALADALARLIDDMTTRQVSWKALDDLVPHEVDAYWQLTLRFLKIAREAWPNILSERGAIEAAARRDLLIAAEAKRLARSDGPVIAAGSTGSMPATAQLLATIARLPHGAVILPGLDTDLDEVSWKMIGGNDEDAPATGHPQFAMHALLQRLEVGRDAVEILGERRHHGRGWLVSEALRPAAATHRWRDERARKDFAGHLDTALTDVAVVRAANSEEESLALAIALREAAEQPNKTAALVTPDRALARRVVAQLARWNVPVDDSGGEALPDTPAGLFARLTAEAALRGLAPVTLLALLKHPLFRLGANEAGWSNATATLERAVLRGPRPKPGTAGLAHALVTLRKEQPGLHRADPRAHIPAAALDDADDLVARLRDALAPLETLRAGPQQFGEFVRRHADVIAALGTDKGGALPALAGFDGNVLAQAFEEIGLTVPGTRLAVAPGDYTELFQAAIADRVVRRHEQPGVRVRIFGPLEARLQTIDRLVLGGLVEGVWPPETRGDPWLSRPMRSALGLDLPERRIALSAHDFAQALGAREVILSYSAKLAGAPTVTSRFMQRLAALAGERWDAAGARGDIYLAYARMLDAPVGAARPVKRPAPKPPVAARPQRLSVTDIENWLRDPYTIYAKHILRITPLDPVDTPPGAADRGTVIHGAVEEFTKNTTEALPDNALAQLLELGAQHFKPLEDYPEARAFWWPRFQRIARWFAGWERGRRRDVAALLVEVRGAIPIKHDAGEFVLTARADRIERLTNGQYAILDYKTGRVPSDREVAVGLSPQLTLEGAILRGGGFEKIAAHSALAELVYVNVRGGDPAGIANPIGFKDGKSANDEADTALRKLAIVVQRFADPDQAYLPLVMSMWKTRYGPYDHLARVKEWSIVETDLE